MTSKERVLSALLLQKPDRVPFIELLIETGFGAQLLNKKDASTTDTQNKFSDLPVLCVSTIRSNFAETKPMAIYCLIHKILNKNEENKETKKGNDIQKHPGMALLLMVFLFFISLSLSCKNQKKMKAWAKLMSSFQLPPPGADSTQTWVEMEKIYTFKKENN